MRKTFGFGLLTALVLSLAPITSAHAAPISTTTVIEAPNQWGVDSNMTIRVQVTADSGSSAPTGTLKIYDNFGAYVNQYSLTPTNNGGYSWAQFLWSASSLGRNGLKAVYTSNSSDFTSSQSTFAGIQVIPETPLTVLRMPDRFVVGTQANLVLVITPPNGGGSATFSANNRQIYASTRNVNGQIAFPWTPTQPIPYTFVSNYSNSAGNAANQVRQSMLAYAN